jgi:hypothetical protein
VEKRILAPATPIDTTEWTHIAATLATTDPEARAFTDIALYVNGVKVAEDAEGHTFPWYLNRGAGIGKHVVYSGDDADGLVYEPRISAGILKPSEFTVVAPPPGIFAPPRAAASTYGDGTDLSIRVENTDSTARNLSAPAFSGDDAAAFSAVTVPTSIGPGSAGELIVGFTPTHGGGTYAATLTINSDDPNRPAYDVELVVEVHDPAVSTDEVLDFGSLAGPGTAVQSILVENLGTAANLTLSNPQITGPDASAYAVKSMPAPIGPGDSGEIEVEFNLATTGDFDATLTLDTDDPFHPTVTVELYGEVSEILGAIAITSVTRPAAGRMRIEFTGAPDTAHAIHSSPDLLASPFTGPVTVLDDGLTTGTDGAGFVEFAIDTAAASRLFYQISAP